jgi:hypothetical protein
LNFVWHFSEQKWKASPPKLSVRVSSFRVTVMPQTGSMAVGPDPVVDPSGMPDFA